MTGGEGADIFKWLDSSLDGQTDVIQDFSSNQGDKIDLTDLLHDPLDDNDTILAEIFATLTDNVTDTGVVMQVGNQSGDVVNIELIGLSENDITMQQLDEIMIIREP